MEPKEQIIEIALTRPIPYGDGTLATLRLRRPKAGDFRGLQGLDRPFDMILDLAARLSDLSPGLIDRVDGEDMPRLIEAVSGFLGVFQGTGKT